jgi:hypothetical protein
MNKKFGNFDYGSSYVGTVNVYEPDDLIKIPIKSKICPPFPD